jgi:uncharacterized protein YbjT (DUF2867 family)
LITAGEVRKLAAVTQSEDKSADKVALVAGANGMVGSRLLPVLRDAPEFTRVYALTRRPIAQDNPRLANRIVHFDAPLSEQLKGLRCNSAFCCLGTTMRTAGSEAAFRAVDHDLVIEFARLALSAGAEQFIMISSVGADLAAKNFYLRVKGETEKALEQLRFRSLSILQPALLMGSRREWRPLELLAQTSMHLVNPLLHGKWSRYRGIDAAQVAAAMCGISRSLRKGVYRYTFEDLCKYAAAGVR